MGRKLAIDIGRARLGIAVSDLSGILSSPLDSVRRLADDSDTIQEILKIVTDNEVQEIYVGDPVSLSGEITPSTDDARNFSSLLQSTTEIPVRLIDERLTTVTAARNLRESGKNAKTSKLVIDSASAVVILEAVLHAERVSGETPGRSVGDLLGS
jgi:putative Holliday junction resolvase